MKNFRQILTSPGALAFGSLTALTLAGTLAAPLFRGGASPAPVPVAPPVIVDVRPAPAPVPGIPGEVYVRARISQTKLARNGDGHVYVELGIETPAVQAALVRSERPTDMIIVLDRSGSMADQRKMDYAKKAIHEVANRMTERDRIALVSFDDFARIDLPLTPVTGGTRELIHNTVNGIYPGASTNIGAGFDTAANLIQPGGDRSVRVLLLSDGEANTGVSSTEGLAAMAQALAQRGAVVSTIGLGADYNQTLLSAISDHGMGNYNYVESLESLGKILESDLRQSRALYAASSELTLRLGEQVTLVSSGDFPVLPVGEAGTYRIETGQLLSGSTKTVTVTLSVPAAQLRDLELGTVAFSYRRDGRSLAGNVVGDVLRVSVVERAEDAIASVRQDVYRKGWLISNVGKAKEEFAAALAGGNKAAAANSLQYLRSAAAAAPAAALGSGGGGTIAAMADEASEMEADLKASFSGNSAADANNQNLLAKKQFAGARKLQRSE